MMKCLLLLLATGLVTSDKLDRTYLPPPGAKHSGGTLDDLHPPLEYPKETNSGINQNNPLPDYPYNTLNAAPTNANLIDGVTTPGNYPKSMITKDLSQTNGFSSDKYQSTAVPTLQPVPSFFGNLPPKSPSISYLPSKQSNIGPQTYSSFNPNADSGSLPSTNAFGPSGNQRDTDYYYYVPTKQTYQNGITNVKPNIGLPIYRNFGSPNQFSPELNNGYLAANGQKYIPTTSSVDIAQNYQPSAFGYYGGNPMIMMAPGNQLPQEFGNKNLIPKFGNDNNILPQSVQPINQNTLKNTQNASARPFQTPLVQLNSKSAPSFPDLQSTTKSPKTLPTMFQTTTTNKSFKDQNMPVLDQRNGILARPRLMPERPQAESDRNAVIINYENTFSPEGYYSYSYDTSNGIHADETGIATNGVRAKGSYSYTGDDGKIYTVTYTADENGFQPKGDHLPTPPPVPEAIKKIIEQAAKDKAAGIIDDGSYDEKKYGHLNYQGAMDRYNQFRKNGDNYLRFIDTKRKQSGLPQTSNKKESGTIFKSNSGLKINEPSNEPSNILQYPKNNENLINRNNALNSGQRSGFNENKQNKKDLSTSRRPITSGTDDKMANEERATPQPDIKYKKANDTISTTYTNIPNQKNQRKIPGTGVSITEDGYYYVPPVFKLNPRTENSVSKQNSYLTTNKPISKTETKTNRRFGFDEPLRRKNMKEESIPTQSPYNINTAATELTTRKPYISGPVNQNNVDYNTQSKAPAENNEEKDVMYPNVSLYGANTTPMTSQTVQDNQTPEQYSQYYQPTTTPTLFDQTSPNIIENRVNIPTGKPGITVSQDFVTTTYRPTISGDGVLEVNQNVKIYGLGKPETTPTDNGYFYNVPEYKENVYSTFSPDGVSPIPGYLDSFYTGPIQDSAVFQGIPNIGIPIVNQYFTADIPGTDSSIMPGPYANIGFDGVPQGDTGILPNFPSPDPNIYGTRPELTTPSVTIRNEEPIIVGEDFSGPKQPQKFDPETGYYYK